MSNATVTAVRTVLRQESYPDLSYLEQDYAGVKSPITRRLYLKQDRERLAAYNRGDWHMVSVQVEAVLLVDSGFDPPHNVNWFTSHQIRSSGLHGVESDAQQSFIDEIVLDERAELAGILNAIGITMPEETP